MTRTFRILGIMLAVGAGVLSTSSAFAGPTPLPANSNNVAITQTDTFAGDVGGGYTVLKTYTNTLTNNNGTTVTMYADAVRTSGGTIDFLYQITNSSSSPGAIDSLSVTDYSNVPNVAVAGLTDTAGPAGTNFVPPTGTPNAPDSANRSNGPGSTITFLFSTSPGADLQKGQTSAIIFVQTTARNFDNSGSGTAASLNPSAGSVAFNGLPEISTSAVPEPGSLVLGSLALICGAGVYGFRRLRRK